MTTGSSFIPAAALLLGVLVVTACSRGHEGATRGPSETMALSAAPQGSCGHAVCAENFSIDVAPGDCVAGSPCTVLIKLAATGGFHINDEYPYRFRADDTPGVEFLGSDGGGKNAFSKAAGDWHKSEEKAGAMNVKFTVADRGAKTLGGTLKLSVCSPQACLLEQRQVTVSVLAK